jgi:hypothetical protein
VVADQTKPPPLSTPTITGIDPLDATLLAISRNDGVIARLELVEYPCVAEAGSADGPACANTEQGTPTPSFLLISPAGSEYITDAAAIEDAVAKALGTRGRALYSVAFAREGDPRGSAFVAGFRIPTGNPGTEWYISQSGGTVGVRDNGADYFGETPIPSVTYICGPLAEAPRC